MSNSVSIRYGDIAPEAKESFEARTNNKKPLSRLEQLKRYNLDFPNYANPCDKYSVALDGSGVIIPSASANINVGFWSGVITGDDGVFASPVVLTLESGDKYFSSSGLTLVFDEINQIHPRNINIEWWRDNTSLGAVDYAPTSANYFCENKVENYNKVVITFYDLNMPKNCLRLHAIDYGQGLIINSDELRKVAISQKIDPISSEISINTADFSFDLKSEDTYRFQAKQPISVYLNDKLISTTQIKKAKRTAQKMWDVQTEDYIGKMNDVIFYGGIYDNKKVIDLLNEIFEVSNVPFDLEEQFRNVAVTGYIPICSCRDALMQVAFAIQAAVDTSNSDVVRIFSLNDEVTQTIPLDRIMQGQNFDEDDPVYLVEVMAHRYGKTNEEMDIYDADEDGVGKNIFIEFSEPLHSLSITSGKIIESGSNYAIIDANSGCLLKGKKYNHTTTIKSRKNDNSGALSRKVVSVKDATLVSRNNIDNVLEKCYNWLIRNKQTNLSIVEAMHITGGNWITYSEDLVYGEDVYYGSKTEKVVTYDKSVNVGDVINSSTQYLGDVNGRIVEQTFNLMSGTIVKKAVLK